MMAYNYRTWLENQNQDDDFQDDDFQDDDFQDDDFQDDHYTTNISLTEIEDLENQAEIMILLRLI